MNLALETERKSPHPTHKVGTVLHGQDSAGQSFTVARSNFFPPLLEETFSVREDKLGNSSMSVHAEVAALLDASSTEEADIYITNFPCPNCAKMIAEARVKRIFIDSHTHRNTPLAERMYPFFETVSLRIFESACIEVHEMLYPGREIRPLAKTDSGAARFIDSPVSQETLHSSDLTPEAFKNRIATKRMEYKNAPFALCFAQSPVGNAYVLAAREALTAGVTRQTAEEIKNAQDKYSPALQPVNRLLAACARFGLTIVPGYLYSSETPTSREWVNLLGAGLDTIMIGDQEECRDEWGLQALKTLRDKQIVTIESA